MRENWNFHCDIAMVLEEMACRYYKNDLGRPHSRIYDADAIQSGHFVEVMIMLLRDITNKSNEYDEIDAFIKRVLKQEYLNPETINKDEIYYVFEDFKRLYNKFIN